MMLGRFMIYEVGKWLNLTPNVGDDRRTRGVCAQRTDALARPCRSTGYMELAALGSSEVGYAVKLRETPRAVKAKRTSRERSMHATNCCESPTVTPMESRASRPSPLKTMPRDTQDARNALNASTSSAGVAQSATVPLNPESSRTPPLLMGSPLLQPPSTAKGNARLRGSNAPSAPWTIRVATFTMTVAPLLVPYNVIYTAHRCGISWRDHPYKHAQSRIEAHWLARIKIAVNPAIFRQHGVTFFRPSFQFFYERRLLYPED
jgi:hypothetical protein